MNLISFSILIIFILLAQNIILVSEETLVLICFSIIIIIISNKFNYLINSFFQNYRIHKKNKLNESIVFLIEILKKVINKINDHQIFLTNTNYFKNYWLIFINNLIFWKILGMVYKINFSYNLCFSFIKKLEYKIIKIFNNSLNLKLYKKILNQNFLTYKVLNHKFIGQDLVILREWIYKKNIKKSNSFIK